MKNNKGFTPVAVLLIVLGIVIIGGVVYYIGKNSNISSQNTPEITATNPSATTQNTTSNWKTFTDNTNSVTFRYPENIGATYISTVDWPPKAQFTHGLFTCVETGQETARTGQTAKKTINGWNYCVTKITEGAAGSTYTQYSYTTDINSNILIFTFSLRYPQCANYDYPQKTACENEENTFNIDNLVHQIIFTGTISRLIR